MGSQTNTGKLLVDGKSLKKSPSVWSSVRDYLCEARGKTFTQSQTLQTHKKYHCRRLETEKPPKAEERAKSGKMLHKATICRHVKSVSKTEEKNQFNIPNLPV